MRLLKKWLIKAVKSERLQKSLGLGNSTVDKWARQLKQERNGQLSSATPLTSDQLKIRELERKIKRLEGDNDILKKASALLMQDSIKGLR